ncbi:MAG TPA: cellulose biosynthesis protein BcsP [Bordetella sp.]|nr:cellulose biosynthesis protein BcsP [Bordetella sp.]
MNPNDDNDIARLFAQFGGDPDTYQEIASVAAAREARSRWPMLSAVDPLDSVAAPAVGADDAAIVAHASRPADGPHEIAQPTARAQFIPPRPKSFNREIPEAFLVPVAPAPLAAEQAAPAAPSTGLRTEPTIDPMPAPGPEAETMAEAVPAPAYEAAPAFVPEPAPAPASAASASSPVAATDPFRRLAAGPALGGESQPLPDLFKRLLSS